VRSPLWCSVMSELVSEPQVSQLTETLFFVKLDVVRQV
jgi:hypothetical protein